MSESKSVNPLSYSDFRSDTSTAPTPEMFVAMMKSSLGDDVYDEDDSVKKLENYVATLCGHEAALFCSSGTMTNQLAHRVHLNNPPQSAIVDIRSHVFNYEAGGISFHSQAAVYPITPENGRYLTVDDIASRLVLDVDVHYAPTRVVSLENTLNGTIMPIDEIERIRALTQEHNIKLHLDGARLWHASIATGISLKEYCSHFDTISLCLSKGIGAPIGSILVGNKVSIKKARHFRLLFGGGWRQAGILAEAALWGINTNWPTMADTHRRAKWLERVFLQVGCQITHPVDTNMVWVDTTEAGFTVDDLIVELAKENIKISGSGFAARIVLHYQITDEAVERFIEVLRKMACTPRMKVSVDLTQAAMRSQPSSIYEEQPNTPSSPVVGQQVAGRQQQQLSSLSPRQQLSHTGSMVSEPTSVDQDEEDELPQRLNSLNIKRCLFEDHASNPEPVSAVHELSQEPLAFVNHQLRRGTKSCASQERPMSAYEPEMLIKVREYEQLEALQKLHGHRNSQLIQSTTTANTTTQADAILRGGKGGMGLRSTQSLDLQEFEARVLVSQLSDRPQTAVDKKKLGHKFQHRLSQNPASKAFKRASTRFVRWGAILNKEA
ncbi:Threonine aldolase [Mortierella alpina]|uniref:Threonine aldolase n=1 Tax=Mortierella alpina TaxID=64518 RepID=A0A9P6JBL0_MORAP|nr:Threonine aldolase [Mortierella alpina]